MGQVEPVPLEEPLDLNENELRYLLKNLDKLTDEEAAEVLNNLDELERRQYIKQCYDDLITFCCHMQDDYKVGAHHRHLAKLLMDIEAGREDRITVSIAPRHGKSQITSIFFSAWYMGRNPSHKLMLVSHTTDLAVDFGRKIRNVIASPKYREIFPTIQLAKDSKSAGRWNTTEEGEFFACGVGSALAGRGANLLVIDDAHSEQDVLNGNFEIFEKAYQWYTYGARTRLMPQGKVAIVGTRWHQDDLIGRVIKDSQINMLSDKWKVVEFPAELELEDGTKKALWPEFFDLDALSRTKASMPLFQWMAQYQQNPTGEEGALVKREWWQDWEKEKPPECEYIIMTLDAAAETHNRADYTGITTWGVFHNEELNNGLGGYCIILLNSIKERYEFPELKKKAMEEYKEWEPDSFIVEKKSAGAALYQELRRIGIPVSEYTPHRGSGDKTARLNSVTDIVASGICYVPRTRWAEELVDEVAAFPFGSNDDLVDCTVMALMRFRAGGFIRLPSDYEEEERTKRPRRGKGYY
jgi:predicted phage terminase large subunit-like protein